MSESNPTPPANSPSDADRDRLLDLLADHALGQPLTPAETDDMNTLLEAHPELQGDALEEAAAWLLVAEGTGVSASMGGPVPAALTAKLTADAEQFIDTYSSQAATNSTPVASPRGDRSVLFSFIGGVLATAAAVGLYIGLLGYLSQAGPPSGEQAYAQFTQQNTDVINAAWTISEAGYEQVAGEVAWSGSEQAGYMVLDGLPANDPAEAQYQLWIVDPARDEFPVDGGVFNVADHMAADGKAYVPIDAKLHIDQPAAFAITLEQPGGVVKSNNALLLVAAVN